MTMRLRSLKVPEEDPALYVAAVRAPGFQLENVTVGTPVPAASGAASADPGQARADAAAGLSRRTR